MKAPPDRGVPAPRIEAAKKAGAVDVTTTERAATVPHVPPSVAKRPSAAPSPSATLEERRRKRDAMRTEIQRGLARARPAGSMVASAGQKPPELDRDYVSAVVRTDFFPLAGSCYETLLAGRPRAAGKAILEFTIVGDSDIGGIVESVTLGKDSTLVDPEFELCLRESFMTITFGAPPRTGMATVVYPLEFAPD